MPRRRAPRRGSLAYLPRARAARPIGRIRYWPEVKTGPKLLAFAGYKAGMTYVCMIESNPASPSYGEEVAIAATVIDAPPMLACAIRAYKQGTNGLQSFTEVWMEKPPKDLERVVKLPEKFDQKEALTKIEKSLDEIKEFRIILATQPRIAGIKNKRPELMEVKVGGGTIQQQFEFAKQILGKEVKPSDVFKEGQYIDVIAISKGKGLAGPVRRWGVSLLSHKARKGRRKPGTLGPWHPAHVLYTVPRAGQQGYHQRTEYQKLILKMGSDGSEVTPKGGFLHYGLVKGSYVLLKGSVPGPAKRLVKMRYSDRANEGPEIRPQITYISLESQQGGITPG